MKIIGEKDKLKAVIIGNGAAGLSAAKAFRKYDRTGSLTVISKEGGQAYSRALLPYVLNGKLPYDRLFFYDEEQFSGLGAEYLEDEVSAVDVGISQIRLKTAGALKYDSLLIASGAHAVWLPIEGIRQDGVCHMWTISDLDKLMPLFNTKKKVFIIGSGFIAMQAAWAACLRGLKVCLAEVADRVMPAVTDHMGSQLVAEKMSDYGVELYTSAITERIERLPDGKFHIYMSDHPPVEADFVIVGAGVAGNTDFLEGSGIKVVNHSVCVDEYMRTNCAGVFAAGDAAAGPSVFGDSNVNHAIWPSAVEMGSIAGANMSGQNIRYDGSINMNVTELFGLTVASMGLFMESDIDDSYIYEADSGYGYFKLCFKDGLIAGICLVGSSEAVSLLGKLKPLIRRRIAADFNPKELEKFLNIRCVKR